MSYRVLMSAPLLLGALVLASCGGNGDNGDDPGAVHEENRPVVEGAREIEVAASSFEFSPDEITVGVGDDVAIVLESEDVLHDFVVDDLGHVVGAMGNETEHGGLRLDAPGEYEFWCSIPGHRSAGMEGTIIVQ